MRTWPRRDTLSGAAGFSASSAKGTYGSMVLLANLLMSWEDRGEDMHLDKDFIIILSLLALGRTRLSFQVVLK